MKYKTNILYKNILLIIINNNKIKNEFFRCKLKNSFFILNYIQMYKKTNMDKNSYKTKIKIIGDKDVKKR